jgi:hypothetical protein
LGQHSSPHVKKGRRISVNTVVKNFARVCGVAALVGMSVVSQASVSQALAATPDLDGVWVPDTKDQKRQEKENLPPFKPEAMKQLLHLVDEEKAGRPFLVLSHCMPHGMPSWMLITHNAFEILTTPGRVTMLGEGDGNRMRRIYTDGRTHPEDPDLTFHGHSIGHWEGETLVVDTVAIAPQAYIAISEAAGVPNNGDMHIVERIHLDKPNVLFDELEVTAPNVLTTTWKTTRVFRRYPERHFEITEGECAQEDLTPGKDQFGNDVFLYTPQNSDGSIRAVKK